MTPPDRTVVLPRRTVATYSTRVRAAVGAPRDGYPGWLVGLVAVAFLVLGAGGVAAAMTWL